MDEVRKPNNSEGYVSYLFIAKFVISNDAINFKTKKINCTLT
jgi:hypothetical protein